MTIQEIKNEIGILNDEMLKLFIRNLELTKQLGEAKKAEGKPLYDRKVEEEILEKAVAGTPQDMQNYSIEFFRTIIKLNKEHSNDK